MFLRRLSTAILLLCIAALLVACTRDRAVTETPTAESATAPTVTEPEVLLLPVETASSTPLPEPTATPTLVFTTQPYSVQPGDTVSTIAEQFGTTSQTIRELNLLTQDTLQPGQLLRVPNTPGIGTADAESTPIPTGPFEYTVKAGDTLLSIAIDFGVSTNEIVAANTLSNPDALFVGQTIVIPGYQPQPTPGPAPVSPYEYVIQSGDSLMALAQRFGVSSATILEANQLRDPNNLIVGQVLLIPGYQGESAAGSTDGSTPVGSNGTHTVGAGETLFAIAQRYGVTVAAISEANGIANPNLVSAGQQLIIPGVSAEEVKAANQIYHTVAAGEGLYAIARQYDVTAAEIAEANNIADLNRLQVGQRLMIPQEP